MKNNQIYSIRISDGVMPKTILRVGVNLREKLLHIQEGRAEDWLQESQKKFTCEACGKPLAVWTTKCHH